MSDQEAAGDSEYDDRKYGSLWTRRYSYDEMNKNIANRKRRSFRNRRMSNIELGSRLSKVGKLQPPFMKYLDISESDDDDDVPQIDHSGPIHSVRRPIPLVYDGVPHYKDLLGNKDLDAADIKGATRRLPPIAAKKGPGRAKRNGVKGADSRVGATARRLLPAISAAKSPRQSTRYRSAVASEKIMKKDNTWNVSVNTDRQNLDDDISHLKVSYSPGKKGGNYGLPLGAKLIVPDGVFNKKDSITCQVAPPTERWKYTPVLPPNEHLTSEIFLFSSTLQLLKKPVVIQIPYYQIDSEHCEVNVKGKWKDENEWVDIGFLRKDETKAPCVELEIDRLGVFAVTFMPKRELFDVTVQGCLYNSRLSKYISIRFAKKATDRNFQCSIQINPITEDKIQLAKQNFPHETNEFLTASEFIDIQPSIPVSFRRPVSVKLPLPAGLDVEDESKTNDIAVLQKTSKGWAMVESSYKFTKTTVTFDTKELSNFCVALSKPERKTVLYRTMPILEERVSKEKGEVLVFINLQEKFWVVILECFPLSRKEERIAERKNKGFNYVERSPPAKEDNDVRNPMFNRRRPPPIRGKQQETTAFEINDGMKWGIEIADDIKCSFDSDYMDNKELQYFKFLPESYRRFVIEPKNNDEKDLIGNVTFVPLNINDPLAKMASTLRFKVDINEEAVKAYFRPEYVPEEPVIEKQKPKIEFDLSIKEEKKEEAPFVPKFKPLPSQVMERLMRTSRKPIVLERESRVLSGKSLMTLSRLVPEGLTLAVHLDLPDSTITGLGFDAISNGLGMVDVTYKILLYWKRIQKDKKDGAVNALSVALREMGRGDIASVLTEKHQENKDLTAECFNHS